MLSGKNLGAQTSMPSLLKTICAVCLFAFTAIAGWSASVSKDEKPAIPADLFFEFKAIPNDENAIINWRRAAEIEIPLNSQAGQIIKYCWTPAAREPATDDLADLQSWLKRNKEALELFDASLQKPKAQWPERNPQNVQPELKSLSLMIRARLFQADQLAEQGRFSEATKSLENSLKLVQRGVQADSAFVHYLVACNTRTLVQDGILRLAAHKQIPVSTLEELLKTLPSLDSETNVYDHVLRAEFCRDHDYAYDLKKLADSWSKMLATNTLLLSLFPDELQRAVRVLFDPSLVPLHPEAYDANAEIEKSIRHYRIYRTNSLAPWSERDGTVELDHEEDSTNLVQDIAPLMKLVNNDALPLNRQAAQKARAAYLEIKNPIGRIIDTSVMGFMASDLKVCQARTEREATRAILALIIFERRKGQLPATLSDLVQEKILSALPNDFFNGENLHYSPEKRKVWSVSNDDEDGGGESGKSRWYGKDAVWQIPELN
jgi:hypothetical protein